MKKQVRNEQVGTRTGKEKIRIFLFLGLGLGNKQSPINHISNTEVKLILSCE